MDSARKEMVETATARSRIYGLLATTFRAEPSVSFVEELKAPELSKVLEGIGISFGEEFYNTPSRQLAEDLAVEYTKLFIGPGPHISPYESVFVETQAGEGGLWGEKTVEVKKFIETAGFTYEPGFTGLPDHLSAELEFMQKLAEAEADLLAGGENERAEWCSGVQSKFLHEHLSKWVPVLCEKISEKSAVPFYARMAEVTRAFLEFDEQMTNGALPEQV